MVHHKSKSGSFVTSVSRRRFLQGSSLVLGAAVCGTPFIKRAHAADSFVWYGTSSARSNEAWAKQFKEKAGIEVETFRTGAVKMAQKFEAEVKASQVRCSVLDLAAPGIFMDWVDRGLIAKYDSPEAAAFPDDIRAAGYWAPTKALLPVITYNRDHISDDEAPKKWEDVLDPKWKGKMVMADAAYSGSALHWFAALMAEFGEDFMRSLSKQDVLLRQGSGATSETIVTGERPLSPMNLHYRAFAAIGKGANLQVVMPEEGVPLSYVVMGLPKDAPNPEAGKKFIDFALSRDAQTFWQATYHTPSLRSDVEPLSRTNGRRPLTEVKRMRSSPADMREFHDKQGEILDLWNELFK